MPLVLSPDSPDPQMPRERWNDFDYANDKEGYRCPFGSHMRRTNPRGDRVAGADGHQRRIIRRGMPYGPPYEEAPNEKRGLLGLFICVSLEDQFEFLMADWINRGGFRSGVPTGATDPLFGSKREEKSQFIIPTEKRPLPLPGLHRFVTTRGGAYCFLPSITALKYIAAL
jgi:deferrochelatase/peroxidase EfeB